VNKQQGNAEKSIFLKNFRLIGRDSKEHHLQSQSCFGPTSKLLQGLASFSTGPAGHTEYEWACD